MLAEKIFLCLVLILVFLTCNSPAGAWNFAVISDTQDSSGGSGVNEAAVSAVTADIVDNRDCAFVLVAGDVINGEIDATSQLLATQYQTFKNTVTATGLKMGGAEGEGVPYYPVRGNHNDKYKFFGSDPVAEWRNAFDTLPQNGPTTAPGGGGNSEVGMTYSFNYDNTLILALDEYINTDHTVNQDWIDLQLASSSAQHVIAFGHEPAYQAEHTTCLASQQAARDEFLTGLYAHNGRVYFCGHDHFIGVSRVYYKDPALGGTQDFYQVIDGTSGGVLRSFNGIYNTDYPADYSVTDLYHDSDPTQHYSYALVTIDSDLLWIRMYGTESLTPVNWQLLSALIISGTLETDTATLTSDVINDSVLDFNQSFDGTFANIISGSGSVIKSGLGTLALTGVNTYTGTTTINAGTLIFSGNAANSDVTVGTFGILQGAGRIKSLTNNGIVRPGNSIGMLRLNGGAFTQSASGELEIEIESLVSYDKISGASTVSLDGTLTTITAGDYLAGDSLNGVIKSLAGISGEFSFLNTNISPTLIWQPQIVGIALNLVATRDYNNDVLQRVLSANEQNIAVVLQEILPSAGGDLSEVKTAIDGLQTYAQAKDAYGQITPQRLNGLSRLSFDTLSNQFYNLALQFDSLRTGIAQSAFTLDKEGAYAGDIVNSVLLAYNGNDAAKFIPRSNEEAKEQGALGFFINGNGNFGDQETTDNQPGFDYTSGGVTLGFDYRLRDNLILGLQSGYSGTEAEIGDNGGNIDVDSVPIGISGLYFLRQAYLLAAIDFSWNTYDTQRRIQFGGLNRIADGSTQGRQLGALLKWGYDLEVKRFTTGPTVSLNYHRLWIDDFVESGAGALNTYIPDQRAESLQLGLGWQIAHRGLKMGKCALTPRLSLSWQHELSNDARSITARLAEGGGTFQVRTDEPGRDFAILGCGLDARLSQGVSLGLNYQASVGQEDYSAQSINGVLRFSF